MAEEAQLCLKGKGEVFLRGRWVEIEAGDVAFFPAGVSRATRNPEDNARDFVLVNSISPPQFDLYEPFGYYDRKHGVMRFEAIEEAKKRRGWQASRPITSCTITTGIRSCVAWNLEVEDIRREGALFNVFMGAEFHGLDPAFPAYLPGSHKAHMLLNLWPGYGVRSTGFHFARGIPVLRSANVHTHPDSDECLILWAGKGQLYCGDRWVEAETFDCVMAPCGVHHDKGGRRSPLAGRWFGGGFASPPQLDLYMKTEYYKDGKFGRPPFAKLA